MAQNISWRENEKRRQMVAGGSENKMRKAGSVKNGAGAVGRQ